MVGFLLVILGHPDEDLAKVRFRDMRASFRLCPDRNVHHPLMLEFFDDNADCTIAGSCKGDVDHWLDNAGTRRVDYPSLVERGLDFATIPINERSIEMRHSQVKKVVNRCSQGTLLSMALRLPLIEAHLRQDPKVFLDLCKRLLFTRKSHSFCNSIGLDMHIKYMALRSSCSNFASSKYLTSMTRVLYGLDAETQFIPWVDERKRLGKVLLSEKKKEIATVKKLRPPADAQGVSDDCKRFLFEAPLIEHLKVEAERNGSACLYSLPRRSVCSSEGLSISNCQY